MLQGESGREKTLRGIKFFLGVTGRQSAGKGKSLISQSMTFQKHSQRQKDKNFKGEVGKINKDSCYEKI